MANSSRPQSPVPPNMKRRNSPPPSPPSPDPADTDFKLSRKREREVSLEPALSPKVVDIDTHGREARTPAKKNRRQLGTTEEEEDGASQTSSNSGSPPLMGISPPQEMKIKVRQISQGVEDLNWRKDNSGSPESRPRNTQEDIEAPPSTQATTQEDQDDAGRLPNGNDREEEADTPPKSPAESQMSRSVPDVSQNPKEFVDTTTVPQVTVTRHLRSNSESGDKGLKRKYLERGTSQGPQDSTDSPQSPAEPTKRPRDDPDRDENPREKKRPSPPPDKTPAKAIPSSSPKRPGLEASSLPKKSGFEASSLPKISGFEASSLPKKSGFEASSLPKKSGFEAYASASSPFASIKGQNIFSSAKSSSFSNLPFSPSSAPAAAPSTPVNSPTPFVPSTPNEPYASSTAPAKRSAFDVFASSTSPLVSMARSKSPMLGTPSKLGRAKSPTRFPNATNTSAFSTYAQGVQSFAAPTPKRPRAESPNGLSNGKKSTPALNALDDTIDSGGSDDGDRAPSFGERLRAEKDDEDEARSDDESLKTLLTEKTPTTGEEDEETIHQVRGKLYALQGSQWKEKGTGTMRLNVKRSDGTGARLVMRKEAVFTLLLNVTLFHGMRCGLAQDPRYLRFSAIEDGLAVHYNLRVPNAKIAQELLEEINANIPPA